MKVVAAFLGASLSANAYASNAVEYKVIDLGLLGGANSYAESVNSSGTVAGWYSSGFPNAAAWTNGQGYLLGSLGGALSFAYDINASGVIVGTARDGSGNDQPFVFSNGHMTRLTVPMARGYAHGINNAGAIVGYGFLSNKSPYAFLLENGSSTQLPTLGGSLTDPWAINNNREVVGQSNPISGSLALHAFRYANGVITDLGTLGGAYSIAHDINDSGDIVGMSELDVPSPQAHRHGFLYRNGQMLDLGTLDPNGTSTARGINASGWVVGASDARAFLYRGGEMIELNSLIDSSSGWQILDANEISDTGYIAAYAQHNNTYNAVLLAPIPEPACGLAVSALGTLLTRRRATPARFIPHR